MDIWMISRRELKNDLLDIFTALNDIQFKYDWIISDHDIWYSEDCPADVKSRWQWTGLLLPGEELAAHCAAGYVHFCFGAILSAVPKGTKPEQVWDYVPGWEKDFEDPGYQFQTPLTKLEIVCYDGYAWLVVCKPELSTLIREHLPHAMPPKEWYLAYTQTQYDEQGNKMTIIG